MRSRCWPRCMMMVAVLPGIAGRLDAQQRIPGAPGRVWLDARWDSVGALPSAGVDTLLINVQQVVMADSMAVIVDHTTKAVSAVSPKGRVLWRFGKTGRGPGEIGAPAALSVSSDGEVWLADRQNARGYRFTRNGTLAEAIGFPFVPERMVAWSAADVVAMPAFGEGVHVKPRAGDAKGAPVLLPQDALVAAAHPSARGDVFLTGLAGNMLAVTFAHASLTLVYDGRRPPTRLIGPEGQAFPSVIRVPLGGNIFQFRLDPAYRTVAWGSFVLGDTLFVTTAAPISPAAKAKRVPAMDAYSISERRYLGTIQLPRENVQSFACSRVVCALLTYEPEPSLSFWRRTSGP